MESPTAGTTVVLDTNVCLDLFVFHDPRWATLLQAMNAGAVRAVTRQDCRREWQIVLTYHHLPLDEASRVKSAAEFDRLVANIEEPTNMDRAVRLPVCSDVDDQKFLELARDSGAEALITKDKALLKLAKKTARLGLFKIMLPEAWVEAQPSGESGSIILETAVDG